MIYPSAQKGMAGSEERADETDNYFRYLQIPLLDPEQIHPAASFKLYFL